MKHTLTRTQAASVGDLLNLDGDAVRFDYAGRGMYGSTCVGFVVGRDEVAAVGAALALVVAQDAEILDNGWEDGLYDALEIARGAATDSMGRATIVYFPNVRVAGSPAGPLDEEE